MNQVFSSEAAKDVNISIAGVTDIGRIRKSNQDAFIIADLNEEKGINSSEELTTRPVENHGWLLAVADGLGGAKAGDVASRLATEHLIRHLIAASQKQPVAAWLRESVKAVNREVRRVGLAHSEYNGMGATLTAAIAQDGRAFIGQVGDSRGYLIREGQIHQVTKDQSLVQALIDAGQITEEAAANFPRRNIILSALGAEDEVKPDITTVTLARGDYLLLCSDGLSNKVGNVEMHDIVLESETLDAACRQLVKLANQRGGEDNITLVLARFDGAGLPAPEHDIERHIRIEHL